MENIYDLIIIGAGPAEKYVDNLYPIFEKEVF